MRDGQAETLSNHHHQAQYTSPREAVLLVVIFIERMRPAAHAVEALEADLTAREGERIYQNFTEPHKHAIAAVATAAQTKY